MNRAAFKSLGILLLGVAVGLGIRRPPERGLGTGAPDNWPSGAVAQSGPARKPASHAAPGVPAGGAGATRETGGGLDLERLAARFRGEENDVTALDMALEAAGLPAEEIASLMEVLAGEKMDLRALEILAVRWAAADPAAALAFALDREELVRGRDAVSRIVGELAKVDLPAAEAALTRLEGEARTDAERAIVRALERSDVRAALAYARGLEDDRAESGVLARMAQNDPLAAAAELTPGRAEQLEVVEKIAVRLLERDRAAFEAWTEGLHDPAQRSATLSASLTLDAGTDPRRAAMGMAAWLAGDVEASAHAGDLAAKLAGKWVEGGGKPAEVAAWARSLPEGSAWNAAVSEAARRWLEQDSMAASIWLRSLPQGAGKDSAVLRLVENISGDTPADAFEWARTVENPTLRSDALRDAVRSWARQDPEAAGQALEALPADDRVYLRDTLEAAKNEREKAQERE